MATYTGTPRTWSAGETVTAALMNSDVRDPLNALAGAWNSYTPTLTGFTPGNGTATGAYLQVGKLVIFRAKFLFGSSSAAASTYPALTLPVTGSDSTNRALLMTAGFYDTSPGTPYFAQCITAAASVQMAIPGSSGAMTAPSISTPFTWTTGDYIFLSGLYEAA